jgi:hypothetical protein
VDEKVDCTLRSYMYLFLFSDVVFFFPSMS